MIDCHATIMFSGNKEVLNQEDYIKEMSEGIAQFKNEENKNVMKPFP